MIRRPRHRVNGGGTGGRAVLRPGTARGRTRCPLVPSEAQTVPAVRHRVAAMQAGTHGVAVSCRVFCESSYPATGYGIPPRPCPSGLDLGVFRAPTRAGPRLNKSDAILSWISAPLQSQAASAVIPARRNRRSPGVPSLSALEVTGVHASRVCLARSVPPAGFRTLLTACSSRTARPCFMPVAPIGFRPSKPSPPGDRVVLVGLALPACRWPEPRLPGLSPSGSPLPSAPGLAGTEARCFRGFHPLQGFPPPGVGPRSPADILSRASTRAGRSRPAICPSECCAPEGRLASFESCRPS